MVKASDVIVLQLLFQIKVRAEHEAGLDRRLPKIPFDTLAAIEHGTVASLVGPLRNFAFVAGDRGARMQGLKDGGLLLAHVRHGVDVIDFVARAGVGDRAEGLDGDDSHPHRLAAVENWRIDKRRPFRC